MDNYSLFRLLRIYSRYVGKFPLQVVIMLALTVAGVAQRMWTPYIIRDLTAMFSTSQLTDLLSVFIQVGLLGVAQLTGMVAGTIRDRINIDFQLAIIRQLHNDVFSYIHGHAMGFFQDNFAGALVKKANRYVFAFENIADKLLFFFFPFALEFLITMGILFSIHQTFGMIMLGYIFVYISITALGIYKKIPLDMAATEGHTHVSGVLADTITNALNLKTFAGIGREVEHFGGVTLESKEASHKLWILNWWFRMAQDGVMLTFTMMLYVTYGIMCYKKMLAPTQVILLFGVDSIIRNRMMDFGWQLRHLYEEAAHAMEMTAILETPHQIQDIPEATTLTVAQGEIQIDGATLVYDNRKIFDDFSLHVQPGEKLGLVGHSGAGKSTLMKMLLRLIEVHEGRILIDGQDITQVSQDSLRANIAYVSQEPILFHRSLFENIAYGKPDATHEEVMQAAKLAHAHHFIMQHPDGYETFVGERGVKLSGGERQRVAIARAILMNPPIVFLDEATAALDSESEYHIQQALHNLMQDKTVAVVAHRLSTVMDMDRIVVMGDGKILEQGTHFELIAKGSGPYFDLWNRQTGSFLPE